MKIRQKTTNARTTPSGFRLDGKMWFVKFNAIQPNADARVFKLFAAPPAVKTKKATRCRIAF
jgi:hypothetical protein